MTIKTRSFLVLSLVFLVSAMLLGCDYFGFTKIKEIVDSPLRFERKEVQVKGVVADAVRIPFTEGVVFTLKDDSGSITVIGVGAKPSNGEKVRVKGAVSTAIKIGNETFGTHITEIKRW
jgi:hypothetical protein